MKTFDHIYFALWSARKIKLIFKYIILAGLPSYLLQFISIGHLTDLVN